MRTARSASVAGSTVLLCHPPLVVTSCVRDVCLCWTVIQRSLSLVTATQAGHKRSAHSACLAAMRLIASRTASTLCITSAMALDRWGDGA